jgi:hypothetical protein
MDKKNNTPPNPELSKNAVMRMFSNVLVEIDGQIIPIRDLPKHEYESFLDDMHKLRLAYILTVSLYPAA